MFLSKKFFEGLSLSHNTFASRLTKLAVNAEKHLLAAAQNIEAFLIAISPTAVLTLLLLWYRVYCRRFTLLVTKKLIIFSEIAL